MTTTIMKYKIAKPEDYVDVEGYAFKTIRAYSQCYYDVGYLLARIDGILNASQDKYTSKEHIRDWLTDIQKEYIK